MSMVGGNITRQEIIERAKAWYAIRSEMRYDGDRNLLHADPDGAHRYGQDCSGFVSMAWHVKPGNRGGPNTSGLPTMATEIPRQNLQAGDALNNPRDKSDNVHHVVLFDAWEADHQHFSYYSFGGNPMKHGRSQISSSQWSGYRAYRYSKVTDGPAAGPATDGSLLREPDGTIVVMAGGAPFRFLTWEEFQASGHPASWTDVPAGTFARMPQTASDGTLLRRPSDGAICVCAGGTAFWFPTWDEYVAAGYEHATFTQVPEHYVAELTKIIPRDGTLLRRTSDGAIYVCAGGAAFSFPNWDEYVAAGYEHARFTNVPPGDLANLQKQTPRDGTLLRRTSDGAIYVCAGGAAFSFPNWDEYVAAGYEDARFTNVPPGDLVNLEKRTPRDGTLLRRASDGAIYVCAGGAAFWFPNWDEYVAAGYATEHFVHLPADALVELSQRTPSDGTLVRAAGDGTVWEIKGGRRTAHAADASEPVEQAVVIPAASLDQMPTD